MKPKDLFCFYGDFLPAAHETSVKTQKQIGQELFGFLNTEVSLKSLNGKKIDTSDFKVIYE